MSGWDVKRYYTISYGTTGIYGQLHVDSQIVYNMVSAFVGYVLFMISKPTFVLIGLFVSCLFNRSLDFLCLLFATYFSLASRYASQFIMSRSRSPDIGRVNYGSKGSQCKNTMGCMAGLSLALVCMDAAGLLVVIQ